MIFYLGTHEPTWLGKSHVPLFVSAVRLLGRCKRKLPRARVPWALDSGGFSVLNKYGGYPWSPGEYAGHVRRWSAEIGHLDWAAVQDWMCEDVVLRKTGLTIRQHQERTVRSWLDLRQIAPDLPWVPVLQGFTRDDYLRCVEQYDRAGTDLTAWPTVGIGSVCRRQDTTEAERIIRELAGLGIRLHGFGFKLGGIERCRDVLASADSLAWSDGARRRHAEERRRHRRAVRTPSLFADHGDLCTAPRTRANDARAALDWQAQVLVRAGITPEAGLLVCPFCLSLDVSPACSSSLDSTCVACGESWGDVREPSLV